jgi:hypothetical protein
MPGKDRDGKALPFKYGTAAFGRLKYRTDDEARGAADDLGLSGIHQHSMDVDGDDQSETFFMPGSDHDALNESLDEQGLPPKPGVKAMGSQTGGGMSDSDGGGMMDMGADDMMPSDDELFGDRPDEASTFQFSGDSDGDDNMELY